MIKTYLDRILSVAVVILMAILLLDVVWQVTARYVFQNPSSFTDELARYLLIWVSLLGAALITGKSQHIAIDIVSSRINPMVSAFLIQSLIALFSLIVMIGGGVRLVMITFELEQRSAALQIPLGVVYSVLPLSGTFIFLYALLYLIGVKRG